MADPSQEYGTIIGADAKLKGDLTFESAAKVRRAGRRIDHRKGQDSHR